MKIHKLFLILFLLTVAAFASAQTYEIRPVNKGNGFIGVEMRITSGTPPTTTNFVTDLVFGLKWLSSYNVDLASSITTNYNIVKSDVRKLKNGFYYQAFSADNTPFLFPVTWQLNEWVEIMSIRNTMTGAVALGNFEITETGFDITTDPNVGVNLVDYTPAIVGIAIDVPLPASLEKFEANPFNRVIHIKWSTTSEQNNKGFEVERAGAEINSFKKIGWVNSKKHTILNNDYEFTDKAVIAGIKYYYRLKQIDHDGKYKYSDIRTAILEDPDNRSIRIMPNPVNKTLTVFFDNTVERGTVHLRIIDSKGSAVLTRNHYLDINGYARLNVTGLTNGQYFLVVDNSKGTLYSTSFHKN